MLHNSNVNMNFGKLSALEKDICMKSESFYYHARILHCCGKSVRIF